MEDTSEKERLLGQQEYQIPRYQYGTTVHPGEQTRRAVNSFGGAIPSNTNLSSQNTEELADVHRSAFCTKMCNYPLSHHSEIDWGDVQDLHDIDLRLRMHGPSALPGLGWRGTIAILTAIGTSIAGTNVLTPHHDQQVSSFTLCLLPKK